jgi:hypothetical protein
LGWDWWNVERLAQGLAADCPTTNISGARDYDSNPLLIWHPQPAADWRQIVNALPNGKQKQTLKDHDAHIEALVSNKKHKSASDDYSTGGHHWPTKAVPSRRPTRSPYYGPVTEVNGRLRRRPYDFRTATERGDVVDVVDHFDAMNREDGFCFTES